MINLTEVHLGGNKQDPSKPLHIDAKGSQCPGPIMSLKDGFKNAVIGQEVIIDVTDPGFRTDVVSWCNVTQNTLISLTENDGIITATIRKDTEIGKAEIPQKEDSITLVLFNEELDSAFEIVRAHV